MKNRSRVNPAAEPHPQGNVGNQVLAHCVLHQGVELFFRRFYRVGIGNTERQRPIGTGGNLAVAPLQPSPRREVSTGSYWALPFGVSNAYTIESAKEELDALM